MSRRTAPSSHFNFDGRFFILTGGAYFIRDPAGGFLAVIKPEDEEPYALNNPKKSGQVMDEADDGAPALKPLPSLPIAAIALPSPSLPPLAPPAGGGKHKHGKRMSASPLQPLPLPPPPAPARLTPAPVLDYIRKGILPGEGAAREAAAYLLDHNHNAGVPVSGASGGARVRRALNLKAKAGQCGTPPMFLSVPFPLQPTALVLTRHEGYFTSKRYRRMVKEQHAAAAAAVASVPSRAATRSRIGAARSGSLGSASEGGSETGSPPHASLSKPAPGSPAVDPTTLPLGIASVSPRGPPQKRASTSQAAAAFLFPGSPLLPHHHGHPGHPAAAVYAAPSPLEAIAAEECGGPPPLASRTPTQAATQLPGSPGAASVSAGCSGALSAASASVGDSGFGSSSESGCAGPAAPQAPAADRAAKSQWVQQVRGRGNAVGG